MPLPPLTRPNGSRERRLSAFIGEEIPLCALIHLKSLGVLQLGDLGMSVEIRVIAFRD
jgi:hypothetical protein